MKTFDKETWERIHGSEAWGKYPSEDVIRFVARNYYQTDRQTDRHLMKILDLGCGAGANTWYLAKEGFDVYAVDGSASAALKTRQYLEQSGLSARVDVGDMAELRYEDCFFDAVIDSAAICSNTADGIRLILKEARRALKNGGKLFSTGLFGPETTGFGAGDQLEPGTYTNITEGPLRDRGTIHFFAGPEEVSGFYAEAGFGNLRIDRLTRTDGGGRVTVSYFMVTAEKRDGGE